MSRIIAAINMKVQCIDGSTYEGVTLAVENHQRLYIAEDGSEIKGVALIDECTALLPPMALGPLLSQCEEDQK